MAKSIGEALAKGVPIVFTRGKAIPEVVCEPGKECQALETMEQMGLIDLVRPRNGKQPEGTIAVYAEERVLDDDDLLAENGWTTDCRSPFEISHQDGSRATGSAAKMVVDELRRQYDEDTKANRHT